MIRAALGVLLVWAAAVFFVLGSYLFGWLPNMEDKWLILLAILCWASITLSFLIDKDN